MTPGIYNDISIEDYHADRNIISSTGLKKVKRSTRDFIHYLIYGTEDKPCFNFGNAFEIALIDKVNKTKEFDKNVCVLKSKDWIDMALINKPDLKVPRNSKDYKDIKSAFIETNGAGKYIIDDHGGIDTKKTLDGMLESVLSDEVVAKLLDGTEYQTSIVWKDKETGLLCKTRPDLNKVKKEIVVDIKTTADASPEKFYRDAANFDYPLQACMQMDGCLQSGLMEKIDLYLWLVVEKTEPYNYAIYEFQKDDIEWVSDDYHYYLKRCAQAIDTIKNVKTEKQLATVKSFGERADNKHGILNLEIPLWYRSR